jgi:hypothetical protein
VLIKCLPAALNGWWTAQINLLLRQQKIGRKFDMHTRTNRAGQERQPSKQEAESIGGSAAAAAADGDGEGEIH